MKPFDSHRRRPAAPALRSLAACAVFALTVPTAAAMAVRAGTAPAAPPAPRGPAAEARQAQAAAAASATAGSALRLIEGQVTALDPARGTMTVGGRALPLHPARLQLFFGHGGRASLAELRPGQRVRFALEPGEGEGRAVVLVYIDKAAR